MRGERAKPFEGLEGKLQRLIKAVTTKAMSKQHMVNDGTQQDLESAAGEQCRLRKCGQGIFASTLRANVHLSLIYALKVNRMQAYFPVLNGKNRRQRLQYGSFTFHWSTTRRGPHASIVDQHIHILVLAQHILCKFADLGRL